MNLTDFSSNFLDERAEAEIAVAELRTTQAIRLRCGLLLERARRGESGWFEVNDATLDTCAQQVVHTLRQRYPHLRVPLHSHWRHLQAGRVDRKGQLERLLAGLPQPTRFHALLDLAVAGVVLGTSAGPQWKYAETATGQTFTRSEGLAVATFHAFSAGLFSSDRDRPFQVDARGLRGLSTDHLARAFQSTPANPLVGLEGRAILLRRLGELLAEQPEVFGEDGRPAGLFDMIISPFGHGVPHTADVDAHDILSQVLASLSVICPVDQHLGGLPLGDCWQHAAVGGDGLTEGWVPFHQAAQWLTMSLLEPFQWAGVRVGGLDKLTALPEYRNGGLLIDTGVLRLRNAQAAANPWRPGDEVIVEWRALTVSLMDALAPRVRRLLSLDAASLPLGCILEGGTWACGRELAQRLRGGLPPLRIGSDAAGF